MRLWYLKLELKLCKCVAHTVLCGKARVAWVPLVRQRLQQIQGLPQWCRSPVHTQHHPGSLDPESDHRPYSGLPAGKTWHYDHWVLRIQQDVWVTINAGWCHYRGMKNVSQAILNHFTKQNIWFQWTVCQPLQSYWCFELKKSLLELS